ncbi:hypothetical protein FRC05_004022 [Tulasnella sp. 425]|nr:hypothetical protein FRC05_004022 [Tulasnella sp. 425]
MSSEEDVERRRARGKAVDEEYERLSTFQIDRRRIVLSQDDCKRSGGYGIVRQAQLYHSSDLPTWFAWRRDGPGQHVAVKQIKIPEAFTKHALIWSRLEVHPGIAKFLGFYTEFESSEVWLLSPWEPYGNVMEFVHKRELEVPEKLSLANVLINSKCKAVLCDLGLARFFEDSGFERLETSTGFKGSLHWCSPEILDGHLRTPASDVYAWAWLVWEIMTGELPYEGIVADYAIIRRIFETPRPQVDGESRLDDCPQVWELMTRCWAVDPPQRPIASMCQTAIEYLPRCPPKPDNIDRNVRSAAPLESIGNLESWKGNDAEGLSHLEQAPQAYEEEGNEKGVAGVLRKQGVVPDSPPSDAASGKMNFEGANTVLVNDANSSLAQSPTQENRPQGRKSTSANGLPAHQPTQFWEAVFPGTPENIYNLLFASGFMKDFLAEDQKLMSLRIAYLYPESESSQPLTRTMSYIKPLNWSFGPRQTKGELKEETVHFDFDTYVSIVTTTRTPDVPNGSIFACKARTCIMWAGLASTKIIVTTGVEWFGRCFIRSIIETNIIEGQRTYHSDLERAMRKYIIEHPTEFIPEDAPSDTDASGSVAHEDVGALITWISPTPVKVNGGFGDVFAGTHSRAGKVALKRPRIGPTGYNEDLRFQREAATWEKLQHPHILKYLGTFQRDGHLYFVSPFIENGTLVEYIVLHPSVNRIKLVCDTAGAISYLHAQGVVHGDIKASNLLVGDEGQVLLCDFGLTKTTDLSTTTAMKGIGSLRWQSPELWDGGSKCFKSDVYAFGMTIAEVLTGDVPFPDLQTEGAVIRAVLIQGRRPTKIPAVSSTGLSYKRVWAVAEACWSSIPEERISMNEASRLVQEDLGSP